MITQTPLARLPQPKPEQGVQARAGASQKSARNRVGGQRNQDADDGASDNIGGNERPSPRGRAPPAASQPQERGQPGRPQESCQHGNQEGAGGMTGREGVRVSVAVNCAPLASGRRRRMRNLRVITSTTRTEIHHNSYTAQRFQKASAASHEQHSQPQNRNRRNGQRNAPGYAAGRVFRPPAGNRTSGGRVQAVVSARRRSISWRMSSS